MHMCERREMAMWTVLAQRSSLCARNAIPRSLPDGSLDPRPLVLAVLRHARVGVLQPRVEDEPRVGPHVRSPVPARHGHEAGGGEG